jgi:hypothetical protein
MSSQRPPPRVRPVRWLQQQWAVALLLQACLLAGALTAVSAQNTTTPPATSSSAALSTAEATADRDILLEAVGEWDNWQLFKSANNISGWNASAGTSACGWDRVTCDTAGRVTELDLDCEPCPRQLEGVLPDVLGQLTTLRLLTLCGNSLRGTLPAAWGVDGAFTELKRLDMSSNSLGGSLPAAWANPAAMPDVRYLNISYNAVSGAVPAQWLQAAAFPALMSLDLASNNLTGPLTDGWAAPTALPELRLLSLAGNDLDGSLPLAWDQSDAFPQLTELDLSRNNFNGSLPSDWGADVGSFPNLTALSLYSNQLGGALPLVWGQAGGFSKLHSLYLDSNFLTGSLPPEWGVNAESWPSLRLLGLSSNQLTGSLPGGWGGGGSLPELQQLFLSYNKLSGAVPSSLRNLESLQDLWLRPANRQLCGALPSNLPFTVCQISGSACVPLTPANFTTGCSAVAVDTSVVEVFIRILGYNLVPFDLPQQAALQEALAAVVPSITAPANITIINIAQASAPIVNVAEPLVDSDPGAGAPSSGPLPSVANASNTTVGGSTPARRLLNAPDVMGWQLSASGAVPGTSLGRRGLRQAVPAAEVFAANDSPLQAVDVTVNLDAGSQEEAVNSDLVFAVSGSSGLVGALDQRGINATETQLLFSSGSPVGPLVGPGSVPSPPARGRTIPSSGGSGNTRAVELTVGIVSGTVVAVLLAALVGICLLWRRAQRRRGGVSPAAANSRWSKMASIFGKGGSAQSGASFGGSEGSGAATPASADGDDGARGLVFPPLNIAQTGIDIDMDNLFRSAGANSDSGCEGAAANGALDLPRVPFSDWELRPEDIEICRRPDGRQWEIGAGAFGQVYKAVLGGVQTVAVKMLGGQQDHAAQVKFCREVAILRSCRASNVVQFQGACVAEGCTMLVTEFMEGGDLWRIMARDKDRAVFGWYRRGKQVALDVAAGLHWLHTHRIVHFDLKSQNILLARDGTAKIADVGLARILNRDYVTSLDMAGTFAWAAPELLLGARCTEKVDIFSFGVVLWELVTGERPLRGQTRELRVPAECPAEVDRLIARCMHADPSMRPSAKEIHEELMSIQYPPTLARVPSMPQRSDSSKNVVAQAAAAAVAADAAAGGPPPAASPLQSVARLSPVASQDGSQAASTSPAEPAPPVRRVPPFDGVSAPAPAPAAAAVGSRDTRGSGGGGSGGGSAELASSHSPQLAGAAPAAAGQPAAPWRGGGGATGINPFGAPDQQRQQPPPQQSGSSLATGEGAAAVLPQAVQRPGASAKRASAPGRWRPAEGFPAT